MFKDFMMKMSQIQSFVDKRYTTFSIYIIRKIYVFFLFRSVFFVVACFTLTTTWS